MDIVLRYQDPTPAHCDVAVFINGALTGVLKLRQEELSHFQHIVAYGIQSNRDSFVAKGNPDLKETTLVRAE